MSKQDITQGEYKALCIISKYSPTARPIGSGIQHRTLAKLVKRGLLESRLAEYGHNEYWLTDVGKQAMDEYPHRKGER